MTPSEARAWFATQAPGSIDYAEMCDAFAAINDGDVRQALRYCACGCGETLSERAIIAASTRGSGEAKYVSSTHRRRAEARTYRRNQKAKKSAPNA